jgi:hypothetical protein
MLIFVITNLSNLSPSRAILLITKNINPNNVIIVLQKLQGIPDIPVSLRIENLSDEELEEVEQANLQNPEKTIEKIYARKIKNYRKKLKEINEVEDELNPFKEMMIQFIKLSDLTSLSLGTSRLLEITKQFFNSSHKLVRKNSERLSVYNFTKYIAIFLNTLIEYSEKDGISSSTIIILDFSYEYSKLLIAEQAFSELEIIINIWQENACGQIDNSIAVFNKIANYYEYLLQDLFYYGNYEGNDQKKFEVIEDSLDDVFRSIGEIGERVILNNGLKENTIMRNKSYVNEFDRIHELIHNIGNAYEKEFVNHYPLIFYDAIDVIIIQLLRSESQKFYEYINNEIYSFSWIIKSISEKALSVNNLRSASLGVTKLYSIFQGLSDQNENEKAEEILRFIVNIGMIASSIDIQKYKNDLVLERVDKQVIEILSNERIDISDEIKNCYQRIGPSNFESAFSFITKLGHNLNTNFGLNFDPITEERYSISDPRRR